MPSPDTGRNVEAKIRRLEQAVELETASRIRANRIAMSIAGIFALLLLCFVIINAMHFSTQLSRDKLEKHLEKELRELSPVAMRELTGLGQELLPVYAEEGRKQVQRFMPEFAEAIAREMDNLTADLVEDSHQRIIASQQNVLTRTSAELFKAYPDLESKENQRELERRMRELTKNATLAAVQKFDNRFRKDVNRVKDTLLKFNTGKSKESTLNLQKRFLRLWLQLLDQEISEI